MHASMRMGANKSPRRRQKIGRHEAEKMFVQHMPAPEGQPQQFQVGHILAVTGHEYALRCGSYWYPNAVVIQVKPLVIVSQDGSMRWEETVRPECLKVIGHAKKDVLERCMTRLKR